MSKRDSGTLDRFTDTVLTARGKSPWPWALLKDHFPAESDQQAEAKLLAWAREHHVDVRWSIESAGRHGQKFRVAVLEPRRRPPIKIAIRSSSSVRDV
jgi:hypothetical protein